MSEIIKFQGDEIEAVREGGDVWVSLRGPCDALGLSVDAQRRRMQRSGWARTTIMVAQVGGQGREVFYVHLDSLPMMLATVQASRVKAAMRPRLLAYQRECARVLRDHFFGAPVAPAALAPPPAMAGTLRTSSALLVDMRRLVGASAKVTGASEQKVRGWIVREFKAASYLDLALPLAAYVRERLMRVACREDGAPWTLRLAAPVDPRQQVLFPRRVTPSA